MSEKYECFITLDNKRYTIVVDKDINAVNFGDVYLQFRKIYGKEDVSLETHVFEIFDFDLNSFKRLSNFQTLVKCMSRIRVFLRSDGLFDSKRLNNCFDLKHPKSDFISIKNDNLLKPLVSFEPKPSEPLFPAFNPTLNPSLNASNNTIPNPSNNRSFVPSFGPSTSAKTHKTHQTSDPKSDSKKTKTNNNFEPKDDSFKSQGLVTKDDKIMCELCVKHFQSMSEGVKHIHSFEHMKNRREDNYEDIDKQFLTDIRDKNDVKLVLKRKQELNKFESKEKKQFIKHGIRVRDGFGPQSYVCLRCDQSFNGSEEMIEHFRHFLDMDLIRSTGNKNDIKSDKNTEKPKHKKHKRKRIEENVDNFKVPKELVEEVDQLRRQGFCVIPKSKHKFVLKCRLCDISTKNISKAQKHSRSEDHNKWKTEMPFKGIDRLIVTECANSSDIEILLTRIEAVRELPYTLKEDFLSHGVKVKDGKGVNAYVCTKCNLLFDKRKSVEKHLEEFEKLKNSLVNRSPNREDSQLLTDKQIEIIEKQMKFNDKETEVLFKKEGIKYRNFDKSLRKQLSSSGSDEEIPDIYYYCLFCNTNFYSKETALYHLNRPFHKKIRRGEYLSPIEAMFSAKTDRIDEFDIAFARMEALYRLDNKTKLELRDKGIRLKDGIGADAYVCLKCNVSIASETIDSALFAIIRHTSSREHLKYSIE